MPCALSPAEIRTKVNDLRDLLNAAFVVTCVDGRIYAVGEARVDTLLAQIKKKPAEADASADNNK